MSTFKLHIVTPTKDFYSGEIEYMSYPAPDGVVGVMKGALPRIAVLKAGELHIKTSVLDMTVITDDGFVFIDGDGVTVLSEKCRFRDDITDVGYSESDRDISDKSYQTAKVKLASTVKKINGKN